jgi:DNA-binding NarL/FixJ family response regulator
MTTEQVKAVEPTKVQNPVVVCVAEDGDLLNLIRRFCSTLPCQTHTTDSAEEALALLGSNRVSLLIADQRLKTMSGTQLLKDVARRSPHTARVLLASYPENHDIIQTEENRIHGIIGKPWDGPSLQRTIMAILRWQEDRIHQELDTDSAPLSRLAPHSRGDMTATHRRESKPEKRKRRPKTPRQGRKK